MLCRDILAAVAERQSRPCDITRWSRPPATIGVLLQSNPLRNMQREKSIVFVGSQAVWLRTAPAGLTTRSAIPGYAHRSCSSKYHFARLTYLWSSAASLNVGTCQSDLASILSLMRNQPSHVPPSSARSQYSPVLVSVRSNIPLGRSLVIVANSIRPDIPIADATHQSPVDQEAHPVLGERESLVGVGCQVCRHTLL
jgi:hypothetical protein